MASITIRKLEETTKRKLKVRAALHGRSMEQEAREILKSALAKAPRKWGNLVERIRAIWEPLGGVELEPYPDEPIRDPDWLKDWK
jgi:antitoxin FitA